MTQNCQECGTPRALPQRDLPKHPCERCGEELTSFTNSNKNYAYSCPRCGIEIELASLVPHWDDSFGA